MSKPYIRLPAQRTCPGWGQAPIASGFEYELGLYLEEEKLRLFKGTLKKSLTSSLITEAAV